MKKQYLFFIRLVIVFALVIFGISKVSATITFNNSADGGGYINSTTNTYALTIGNGINRLLVVQAWSAATGAGHITGITYNGIALTKIAEELESGQSCYVSLWYLLSPASGTNNIEVTTDVSGIISTAASYTGVRQFGQPDASVGNHGLRPQTFTLTTATDNSWTVIGIRCLSGSPTAVTGATLRQSTAAGAGIFDSNGPTTPAGSTSMTISNTSNNQVSGVMASFAPAHSVFFSSECTGGIKTHYGGNTIHTFTSSGTLVCTGTGTVRVLVVAGGGGTSGADNTSGGGGAGGLIENFAYSASGNISVTIGNGGTGQTNGQNSLFGSLT
ncbi:MAG: hypothetical protein HGB12_16250, partial [Bacteroidetes bacterium]|nr:hypothetical protein [Bacteroidota bacterium]